MKERVVRFAFVAILIGATAPSLALRAQPKPNITPDPGLPLPSGPAPERITNSDGSVTTVSRSGRGTKAETVDQNGTLINTVYRTPTYDGGQITKVETGPKTFTIETDKNGTVRNLQKTDSETLTKNAFEYNDKGELVKAIVFKSQYLGGKEEPQEIYDAKNTRSGYPEKYVKDKDEFVPAKGSDWTDILERLNKTVDEIKASAPPEKDPLEEARMEAAKHPMGEGPEPPERPGSNGSAAPIPPPKPREGLALPSNPLSYDPCLLGTWEATSYQEVSDVGIRGGAGFRVIFTKDEQGLVETIDYSKMAEVWAGNDKDPIRYRGSASARINAKDGVAQIGQVLKTGATWNYRDYTPLPFPTLGPGGLGSAAGSTSYVCTNDTLEYHGTVARDRHPNTTVKLTRVK